LKTTVDSQKRLLTGGDEEKKCGDNLVGTKLVSKEKKKKRESASSHVRERRKKLQKNKGGKSDKAGKPGKEKRPRAWVSVGPGGYGASGAREKKRSTEWRLEKKNGRK